MESTRDWEMLKEGEEKEEANGKMIQEEIDQLFERMMDSFMVEGKKGLGLMDESIQGGKAA